MAPAQPARAGVALTSSQWVSVRYHTPHAQSNEPRCITGNGSFCYSYACVCLVSSAVRRPVILPDYSELEFRISEDARSPAMVCLDGKVFTQLQIGDSGEQPTATACLSFKN